MKLKIARNVREGKAFRGVLQYLSIFLKNRQSPVKTYWYYISICCIIKVDMCLSKPGTWLLVVFSALIAAGCGELDTILSSKLSANPVYRVNAAVEGRSLDECAILGIGSRIRPYFLDPIENDPDITGLVVFLETPAGELVSRKVRYIPGSANQSSEQLDGIDTAVDGQIPGDEAPKTPAGQTVSGEDAFRETGSGAGDLDAGSGESREDGIYETSPADDGYSADGASGLDDNPEEKTVYQIREKKTFSGTGDISEPDELVIYVPKLSAELPVLLLPEKLTIGPYILVFQVLGLQGVLSDFEKLIYYISDAELALGDIQTYHSGNAERSGVVSPDSALMLETRVSADKRLAPYIVWYHGKKRLREGPVSGGVDRFLWKTPAQTGFQALRAEVFPFTPPAARKDTGGLVKELSLAVSSKQARRAVGNTEASPPDSITWWYQFNGDLSDSLAPQDGGRELKPGNDTVITWLPKTGIYGLAVGPGYSYTIPGSLFTPDEKLPGRGQLVFRFTVQSSGIISSSIFTLDRTSQTLKLDLSFDADTNCLILNCALGEEKQEQKLSLPFFSREEWITAVVDFTAESKKFRAELSLLSIGNGEFQSELASLSDKSAPAGEGIVLPGALTGEGVFRIGSAVIPANSSTGRTSVLTGSAAGKSPDTVIAAAKSGADDNTAAYGVNNTASQSAAVSPASFITGEENQSAAALPNTAVAAMTAVNSETEKNPGTDTPAPVLILDALAVLFRVIDPDMMIAAEEPAEAELETASEDAAPPEGVSPEQPEEQVKLSAEKSVSGTGQTRQPLLPAKPETENNANRDSGGGGKADGNPADKEAAPATTGKETDLTENEKTEDGDQAPDARAAETLSLSDPEL
jgi:hypothetical protein